MFRCHFCQEVTPPGTKKHNIVIATREKVYPSRRQETRRGGGRGFRSRSEPSGDAGGKGVETTKEVAACPSCAAAHTEPPTMTAIEVEATPETDES